MNGFFDVENRLAYLTANGDILPPLKNLIPWEEFRSELEIIYAHERKSNAGRRPFDVVMRFTGKCRYGITELANRLRDTLMSDFALVEVLNLNRDTLKKPPDWNAPEQLDLFANCCNLF